jgi:hypothetical protein
MKSIIILFLFTTILFSKIYYAKLEPYEIRNISSNVSGLVLFTDDNMIGKKLSSKPYIKIDSKLDEEELSYIQEKLTYLQSTIDANEKILKNLKKLLKRKNLNYEKIKVLKIKSSVEKDKEFYNLIASENQYLSTLKELNNLKVQIADLKLRKSYLTRSIEDKNLQAKDFVLYSISVKVGQVVGVATPLAKVADISKAKLCIFLDKEDLSNVENKIIYLDGIKTDYKLSRILKIADEKNISKYMAQIIIKSPKVFSKLIKVELK